jgi:hypothetical protein
MNRISDSSDDFVAALLQGIDQRRPIEALVIDRERLLRVLRNALFELHTERQRLEGTPDHPDVVRRIRYLDAILGWVKEQPGELVLIGRR